MKKFLAIVFTLIFALSACTVAFAATVIDCPYCDQKFETTDAYNTHVVGCKAEHDAANEETLHRFECLECRKVFESEEAFNNHFYYGGCDVMYTTCGYCEDRIHVNCSEHDDCIVEHYKVCIKYSDNCKYCGKSFTDYTEHMKHQGEDDVISGECCVRTTINNDDISKVIGSIIIAVVDFFKTTDWGAVLAKVGEVVGGIDFEGLIGKVTGFIGGIDFEGLLGKVTGAVEGLAA